MASAAAEDRLLLTWRVPAECPTATQVRADVRALLVHDPTAKAEKVTVEATIRAIGDSEYQLSLSANGQSRQISGVSCAKLAQAAALLMALLLDPNLARSASDVEASPNAVPDAKPTPASAPEPPKEHPRAEPTRRLRADPNKKLNSIHSTRSSARTSSILELGGRLDWGTWPNMEPTLVAGVGVERTTLRLLSYVGLGRGVHLHDRHGHELKLIPFYLGIQPAYRFTLGQWGIEPGVGVELGVTHTRSTALLPATRNVISMIVLAQARVTRDFGVRFRGWLGFGPTIPVVRPRWLTNEGELLHQIGPGVRVDLGLGWRP